MLASLSLAVAGAALLWALSLYADGRLAAYDRVPYHWGLGMRPNAYGPRLMVLFAMPVAGGAVLLGLAVFMGHTGVGPIGLLPALAATLFAHTVHIFLAIRTLERG